MSELSPGEREELERLSRKDGLLGKLGQAWLDLEEEMGE